MNKYDTGNYNYCIKNTTAVVWNLTPPPANIALNYTSTARDTPSIKVDITGTWYTLSLCVNFWSFFLLWIACDTPSIKVDTTEQQVARHNQPNIYIHTTNRQQNTQISTTSGETFNTIYNTNQKTKVTRYILASLQLIYVHIL